MIKLRQVIAFTPEVVEWERGDVFRSDMLIINNGQAKEAAFAAVFGKPWHVAMASGDDEVLITNSLGTAFNYCSASVA
ncbi:hypothetical protein [Yoonia sp. SDW83-1]|uniref:hypothetical protein n=1 Tax=Yoonia sp. SDW83-1 TaxID=3366945 RepID=UPI00398C55DF